LNDQYPGTFLDREPLFSITFLIALHAFILIFIHEHFRTAVAIEPLLKCKLAILIMRGYIKVDAVELLEATRRVLALEALDLAAALPPEDLLDRRPRLVSNGVAHSRRNDIIRGKEAGVCHGIEELSEEFVGVFLGLFGKDILWPDAIKFGQY
jgi:hypothetical protein